MAADDEFDEAAFYDHAKRAQEHYANRLERRHHASALKDFMHWMDRSGAAKAEAMSPGAKAAHSAATQDTQEKELKGRIKIVAEEQAKQDEPTPVADQPKDFGSASEKAHEVFMQAVGKKGSE